MFRRLLALGSDPRLLLPLIIFLGWAAGLAAILQAWMLSGAVDGVFLGGQDLQGTLPLLLVLGGCILLRAAAQGGAESAANALALRVKETLRTRLLAHLARLGPAASSGERSGEQTAAAVEGIEALDAWFSQYLPQIALAALIPLTMLMVIFPIDPLTGIVFLFTAPLIPLFMYLIGSIAEKITRRQWETLSRLSATLLDTLQGLATIKALGQSQRQAERQEADSERYRDVTLKVLRITFLSALTLELISTISVAIVAVEIGLRLLHGGIGFHEALFILVLAPELYLPLRLLGLRFHAGMAGTQAARRIFAILDTPAPPGTAGSGALPGRFAITLRGVSYVYAGRDLPALDQVDLDIPHGRMTALVGASGAGKSTIASLLLRFIEADAGEVLVDGVPLGSLSLEAWRGAIAWVPQKTHIFNDTLAANLRLAKADATETEMLAACRRAGLDPFLRTLPQELETPAGESGAQLSGGQAQRLALARAFLRDAPLLILDEPTSSLDPHLEAELTAAVMDLVRGRTVLVIAHRLNTVRHADQIVVLDSGRVVETGTHDSLLATGGRYARLARAGAEAGR